MRTEVVGRGDGIGDVVRETLGVFGVWSSVRRKARRVLGMCEDMVAKCRVGCSTLIVALVCSSL
jgi:hypothetical protein